MRRSIVVLCSILFFITSLSAQVSYKNAKLKWGPQYKWSLSGDYFSIITSDAEGYYVLTEKAVGLYGLGTKYFVSRYNNNMEVEKVVEIELKEQDNELKLEYCVELNNNIYIFSSFKNKKTKMNYLFYQTLNKTTLFPEKNLKKISEINYDENSYLNPGEYSFSISNDSSKFAINYMLPYNKGENEKFGFQVFDNNLNEIYKNDIQLKYKDEQFFVIDFSVNNNGTVNMLGVEYDENNSIWSDKPSDQTYHALIYSKDNLSGIDIPLSLENKYINDVLCDFNNNNELVCAGFFSSNSSTSIEGNFYLRLNPETGEMIAESHESFSMDFITENMTDKQKEKTQKKADKGKDVEMPGYEMKGMISKDDGGVIIIGEQYWDQESSVTSTASNGNTSTKTTIKFHYNNIIIININPSGNIAWTKSVPKRQTITYSTSSLSYSISSRTVPRLRFCSFFAAVSGDNVYLIYNDNPENMGYVKGGKIYETVMTKSTVGVLVEVDKTGEYKKKILFNSKDDSALCVPELCTQLSDNELLVFGAKGNKYKFGKVSF